MNMEWEHDIQQCVAALRRGGIILYPTDTVWGLGCDATNAAAVSRIYALKNRIASKAMIILVADDRDILEWVSAPDSQVFDYLDTLAQPTTIVFDGVVGLADNLLADDGTLGIRVVRDEFCRHLIKRLGKPIVSTSANRSGDLPPSTFDAIDPAIKEGVDYIAHYRRDDPTPRLPSRVVRWNKDGSITVLRD